MGTTGPPWNLPYPELTDPADVPTDMEQLAAAVAGSGLDELQSAITALTADLAALQAAIPIVVAFQAFMASVNITGTTEGQHVIAATSPTEYLAVEHEFQFSCPALSGPNVGTLIVSLYDGATQVARIGLVSAGVSSPCSIRVRFTPSAGTHAYQVKGNNSITGHTSIAQAGVGGPTALAPGYLRIVEGI